MTDASSTGREPKQADHTERKRFFGAAADRIEFRARRARRTGHVLAWGFFLSTYALILIGVFRVTDVMNMPYPSLPISTHVDAEMQARLAALIQGAKVMPDAPTETDLAVIARQRTQIDGLFDQWQRLRTIAPPERSNAPDWYASRWLVHYLALACLAILTGIAIRVALMFCRYYARLAEFLDTQVDALRLSDGDPDMAVAFMQQFSPNAIGLEPAPKALHEAFVDAVTAATAKRG